MKISWLQITLNFNDIEQTAQYNIQHSIQIAKPQGGDMASTGITKSGEHAVGISDHLKSKLYIKIVANDNNYALAA